MYYFNDEYNNDEVMFVKNSHKHNKRCKSEAKKQLKDARNNRKEIRAAKRARFEYDD